MEPAGALRMEPAGGAFLQNRKKQGGSYRNRKYQKEGIPYEKTRVIISCCMRDGSRGAGRMQF